MIFDFLGDKKKAVISMAHIGALPGSPLYDADGGVNKLIDDVISDIEKMQNGGVDAIMFGNENDRPYYLKATSESVAAMTAVVSIAKQALKVPFGVNYLWDPTASVAIGAVTGASFVREIFTGVFASDMGIWAPDCATPSRLRRNLNCQNVPSNHPLGCYPRLPVAGFVVLVAGGSGGPLVCLFPARPRWPNHRKGVSRGRKNPCLRLGERAIHGLVS